MNKCVAHETTSGHVYFVVARTDERSPRYCATGRGGPGSSGAGAGAGGGERFANVGAVRIEAIMSQRVAGVQTERALVHVLASFLEPIDGESGVVARPETGWTSRGTSVTALRVDATLAYSARRYPVDAFVDVYDG